MRYAIQNPATGTVFNCPGWEAMLWASINYNVYRLGGSGILLLPHDIALDIHEQRSKEQSK